MKLPTIITLATLLLASSLFAESYYTQAIGLSYGRSFSVKIGSDPNRWEAGSSNIVGITHKSEFDRSSWLSYGATLQVQYTNFPNSDRFSRPDYIYYNTDGSYDYNFNEINVIFSNDNNTRVNFIIEPFLSFNNLGSFNIQFGIPIGYSYLNIPTMIGEYQGIKAFKVPTISNHGITLGFDFKLGYTINPNFKINMVNAIILSGKKRDITATEYNYIDGVQVELDYDIEMFSTINSFNFGLELEYYFDF